MLPEHLCRGLLEHMGPKKKTFVEHFAVLTPTRLLFFRINEEWVEEKPPQLEIHVPAIIGLEDVSDQGIALRRQHCFQVTLSAETTARRSVHVLSASSGPDLHLWMDCLGKARLTNEVWLLCFHPGTLDERWSCCRKGAAEEGCRPTSNCDYPSGEDPSFRAGHAAQFQGYRAVASRSLRLSGQAVARGEVVVVVGTDPSNESQVTVVSASSRQAQGAVGRDLLRMGDIREESWFFQELPPTLATALLQCMASGTFLVRSFRRRLALSLVVEDTVRHHWIHQDEKGLCYVEAELRFPAIQEMVLFYSKQARLGHRLNQFPKRENLEKLWQLDGKQLDLKTEIYSHHLPFAFSTGSYGPVPVLGMSSRPKQIRAEVEVLRRTARMLMCLDHPNLVKLIGVQQADADFALVLEDVPPLLSFIASYGLQRLLHEWEILVGVAHHLASALLYLHRKGIVHNEVVMENCFLHPDTFTAKLGNFQYARFEDCRPDAVQEELLHRHCRLPLPPPEVALQGQASSCQTDVWGFGILLWTLFHSGGQATPIADVQQLLTTRLPSLVPELTAMVGQLVYSCVHEVPQLRISAYELVKQLRSLLELKKQLKRGPARVSDLPSRTASTPQIASAEATAVSPSSTVKAKKKRRFLRYGRKSRGTGGGSTGGESPASTTASSLENVVMTPGAGHSRSASASPASGVLRGLRGFFRPPLSSPASGDGASDSAASSLPPGVALAPSATFPGGGRGSDSAETLSWDGWAPEVGGGEAAAQYDRLREYCRALLVRLRRERRERARLGSELARVREELECRVVEAETAAAQAAREAAVQRRADEERLRRLQAELDARPPRDSSQAALEDALRRAELRLSAYEALTAKLQAQLYTGSASGAGNSLDQRAGPSSPFRGSRRGDLDPARPDGASQVNSRPDAASPGPPRAHDTSSGPLRANYRPDAASPGPLQTGTDSLGPLGANSRHYTVSPGPPRPSEASSGPPRPHRASPGPPRPDSLSSGPIRAIPHSNDASQANHKPTDASRGPPRPDRQPGVASPEPALPPRAHRTPEHVGNGPVNGCDRPRRTGKAAKPQRPAPAPPQRADSIGGRAANARPLSHARTPSSDTSTSSPRPPAFSRSPGGARPSDSSSSGPGSPLRTLASPAATADNMNTLV